MNECTKIEIVDEDSDKVFKRAPSEMSISGDRFRIFAEIDLERKWQHEIWGEQNHRMLAFQTPTQCEIKSLHYKRLNKKQHGTNAENWFNILAEEMYEAFAEKEPEKQRKELVQMTAVVVQIIEYLDRKECKD
jgi:hypothetical protein